MEQRILGIEVVVDVPLLHPGPCRDVGDPPDGAEAELGDGFTRRLKDLFSTFRFNAGAWHRALNS